MSLQIHEIIVAISFSSCHPRLSCRRRSRRSEARVNEGASLIDACENENQSEAQHQAHEDVEKHEKQSLQESLPRMYFHVGSSKRAHPMTTKWNVTRVASVRDTKGGNFARREPTCTPRLRLYH